MKFQRSWLKVFVLILGMNLVATSLSAEQQKFFPDRMSSMEWRKLFLRSFPDDFCAQGDYFYECYLSNRSQCVRYVRPLTLECLNGSKLRPTVQWPQEGMGLGMSVGACVAKKFLTKYEGKRRDLAKCKSDKQW